MRSPALGIAESIWARNRSGFLCCAAGLAAMALVYPALFAFSRTWATLVASAIPLIGVFGYVLNAAVFAEEPGSLSSCYPRHMLVLPAKGSALAFWPMLFGSLLVVSLWIFTARVIYAWSGLAIPVGMPALVLVVAVSWFQALAWSPLAVRWIRDLVAISATLILGALPIWIIRNDPGANRAVVAVLLAYLAGAWALALAAVTAQRRGDLWLLWFQRRRGSRSAIKAGELRLSRAFRSAATAQLWYEWRCHGLAVIGFLCGMMLSIWACLLSAGKPVQAPLFPLILGLLLAAPVVTVGSVGPAIGRFRPFWIERRDSDTFLNVRPMGSAAFVAAKMRLATLTVIVSWVFILAGTVFCIVFSHSVPAAITTWRRFTSVYPGGQAPVICGLVCVLLPALSWRFLTDGLPFVLTGRKWIADGSVWLYLAALLGMVSGGLWLATHRDQLPRVLALVPSLVVLCAMLKAGAAAAAYRAAMRRRLIAWQEFWRGFAIWSVLTGLAVALVLLLKLPPAFGSKSTMVLGIATFVPLVRFPLATLALEWSRHR